MPDIRVFNNFKMHTQYSICEGAIKIDDLANYCKENKIPNKGCFDYVSSALQCNNAI